MARYIDAEKLVQELNQRKTDKMKNDEFINGIRTAISLTEWQPTADVEEVKHAYWIDKDIQTKFYCGTCSHCGLVVPMLTYCGICGARMDGKKT